MPKKSSASTKGFLGKYNSYPCRICKRPHPLRTCRKFLAMNMAERISAVRKHKYCSNCLAHDHSQGTCFSKHGCKTCKKFHHTLLHVNPRLVKDLIPSRSRSSSRSLTPEPSTSSRASRSTRKSSTSKVLTTRRETTRKDTSKTRQSASSSATSQTVTWTTILRQNSIVLLPTILVKIGSTSTHARSLLDSASAVSRVAKGFIEKLGLTTYTLNGETVCPLVLKSRFDSNAKIEGTFRVDNRVGIRTPAQSLPETYKENFKYLFLADSKFYESGPIDIVIGVDIYPKVISEGVISRTGFPTAQSTVFGWIIYGPATL